MNKWLSFSRQQTAKKQSFRERIETLNPRSDDARHFCNQFKSIKDDLQQERLRISRHKSTKDQSTLVLQLIEDEGKLYEKLAEFKSKSTNRSPLVNDANNDLSVVIEILSDISNKVDHNTEVLDRLDTKVGMMEERIEQLREQIKRVVKKFDSSSPMHRTLLIVTFFSIVWLISRVFHG
jgi:DNA repair ATPase RecN